MLVLVPIVPKSPGLYGEVANVIREYGSPAGDPVVQVAYRKSSLNLLVTRCINKFNIQ
jgi:hypothetical protein